MERSSTTFNRNRINDAVDLCFRQWIPVSEGRFQKLKQEVDGGVYIDNSDGLVEEILTDPALFFHCLRELEKTPGVSFPLSHPVKVLKKLPLSDLSEMLQVRASDISIHLPADASRINVARVKHSIISSETARYIAESKTLDPSLTVSVALLRQLGHLLMSWNFKRTYTKALDAQGTKTSSVNDYLETVLGFTPEELSRAIAHRLNLDHNIVVVSGDVPPNRPKLLLSENREEEFKRIEDFCLIGEAFARISDFEFHPQSLTEFAPVRTRLVSMIGEEGLRELTRRVEERAQKDEYVFQRALIPEEITDPEFLARSRKHFIRQRIKENPFLEMAPASVRQVLRGVYDDLDYEGISVQALNSLILEVLPALGFQEGCVYLLDTQGRRLIPKLRLGKSKLSHYQAISYDASTLFTDPIGRALHTSNVEQHPALLWDLSVPITLSCRLGNREAQGVISLVTGPTMRHHSAHELSSITRAVGRCIEQCLAID